MTSMLPSMSLLEICLMCLHREVMASQANNSQKLIQSLTAYWKLQFQSMPMQVANPAKKLCIIAELVKSLPTFSQM